MSSREISYEATEAMALLYFNDDAGRAGVDDRARSQLRLLAPITVNVTADDKLGMFRFH